MRLVRQLALAFQEGSSDKVYEIDLCEVGPGEFVVNFRYGRRGANLKEGTKTVFPVSLEEAEKAFEKLAESKRKKGYQEPGAPAVAVEKSSSSGEGREASILKRLHAEASGDLVTNNWPLSRVIWQAGAMRLVDAVPDLLVLGQRTDEEIRYSTAWALGRCKAVEAADLLQQYLNERPKPHLVRMVDEALLAIGTEEEQATLLRTLVRPLPEPVQAAILAEDQEALKPLIAEAVGPDSESPNAWLFDLYQQSVIHSWLRDLLLEALEKLPLKAKKFKPFRYVWKAAEFRSDWEMMGLLMARIQSAPATYSIGSYWRYTYVNGDYVEIDKEQAKPDSRLAFSNKTQAYFRRRMVRLVWNLGLWESEDFTRAATQYLLLLSDAKHRGRPYSDTYYRWDPENAPPGRSYITTTTHYHEWSNVPLLNKLLFSNSPRYQPNSKGSRWHYRSDWERGSTAPDQREEAYPHLWDQDPQRLLLLLADSRAQVIAQFAAKALNSQPEKEALSSADWALRLLESPFPEANGFGLEMVRQLIAQNALDRDLVMALVHANLAEARELGLTEVQKDPDTYSHWPTFMAVLILTDNSPLREWASDWIPGLQPDEATAKAVVEVLITQLLEIRIPAGPLREAHPLAHRLRFVRKTLAENYRSGLTAVSATNIRKLLFHSLDLMRTIGSDLLAASELPLETLGATLLSELMADEDPILRSAGLNLFLRLPEQELLQRAEEVVSFACSEASELREAAIPVLDRLVALDAEFATATMLHFLDLIQQPEAFPGLHRSLAQTLNGNLKPQVETIPDTKAWDLMNAPYPEPQRIGAQLLLNRMELSAMSLAQIQVFGNSTLIEYRKMAQNYYAENATRIRQETDAALALTDSEWDDTRNFAFGYFRGTFTEQDWTPELLIRLCDSVRADVEAFGRELLTRYFTEENGPEYLQKLSQHPSKNIQLLATNYLERYASGKPDMLEKVNYFLFAVLGRVNVGRATKERVLHFMREEAMTSEAAAQTVLPILEKHALSFAMWERAACLLLLRDIRAAYPDLTTRLQVKPIPVAENTGAA